MKRKALALAVCLALSPGVAGAAATDGTAQLRAAVRSLVDELVRNGVLPQERAGEVVERAMLRARRAAASESRESPREAGEAQAAEPAGGVRVPYIPEPVRKEIIEQIRPSVRQDVVQDILKQAREERWGMPDAFPAWVNRISFFGDIRLRAQTDNFAAGNTDSFGNPSYYPNIQRINQRRSDSGGVEDSLNTTEDQKNMRLQVRVGMLAKVSESVDALVRISTGSTNNPVSTNYTFSNSFSSAQLVLDQGYLRYQSDQKSVTLLGGRLPNPFLTTDLVWDNDLNFDGLAATYRRVPGGAAAGGTGFRPFLTLGAFPMQTPDRGRDDKWLYGSQLGFDWGFGRSKLSVGAAYYAFSNIVGQANALGDDSLDYTAPQFVQKGNTVYLINDPDPANFKPLYGLASEFREVDLIGSLDTAFGATHVIVTAHYVKNIGFDLEEVRNRITSSPNGYLFPGVNEVEEDSTGYLVKLTVGAPKLQKRGDWQTSWTFRRLGRDAVVDAFTDSDFHLGGTDAKGWILGGSYAVARNTWLSLRYLTSDAIKGQPFGIDTWQLDINARF